MLINKYLISYLNKSVKAGALVLGVIKTDLLFFTFCLINGRYKLINSLAFYFSFNGTLSSISGTKRVAPEDAHFFNILSWLPGTYKQDVRMLKFKFWGLFFVEKQC